MRRRLAAPLLLAALLLTGCTQKTMPLTTSVHHPSVPPSSSVAPRTGPSERSTPTSAGCSPTAQRMPPHAVSARVPDVDGDGRPDVEWAKGASTVTFGITTASGATVSGSTVFAGGGTRSFVLGRLADGVVIALPSEGRDSPLWSFVGCRLAPVIGRGSLPDGRDTTPFVVATPSRGGAATCVGGRLYSVESAGAGGGRVTVLGRRIDVTADGRRAVLSRATTVLAEHVRSGSAEERRFAGVSCGSSVVLHPQP
jgi:hypothetical protein